MLSIDSAPAANGAGRLFPATPEEDAADRAREQDRQIKLLIGAKNLERLHAFGFEVVQQGAVIPQRETDGRSLERETPPKARKPRARKVAPTPVPAPGPDEHDDSASDEGDSDGDGAA